MKTVCFEVIGRNLYGKLVVEAECLGHLLVGIVVDLQGIMDGLALEHLFGRMKPRLPHGMVDFSSYMIHLADTH